MGLTGTWRSTATIGLAGALVAAGRAGDLEELVRGHTRFALELHRRAVAGAPTRNFFASPYSVSVALAMTYLGARGETAAEMKKALAQSVPDDRLEAAYDALRARLRAGSREVELAIANRLWGAKGYGFSAKFLDRVTRIHRGGLVPLDFRTAPEPARDEINGWIKKQTRGMIPELVPRSAIDPLTRLVLTNAIYFKGAWADEFSPERTRPAPFTRLGGETRDVPMMRRRDRYRYARIEELRAATLELPYRGEGLAMLLVLPDAADGLPALEAALTPEHLAQAARAASRREVELGLPRFSLTSDLSLREPLVAMGMVKAFDPDRADFLAMLEGEAGERLHISAAIHQARVEVTEKGTEAAAATAAIMAPGSAMPTPPIPFLCDRPFLFAIREPGTGELLFLGRLADPR